MKVVDMHCDTIAEIFYNHRDGGDFSIKDAPLRINLEKMQKGDYLLQNFALFTNTAHTSDPFMHGMYLADLFYEEMERYPEMIGIVKNYEDIENNRRNKKMSAMLTIEEGAVCKGEISLLRDFYRIGVRMMTLVWNYENELAYPAQGDNEASGLKKKGFEFLEEMEDLGMIVDVSHMNDQGVRDVISHAKKPFVASHSNARRFCCHKRTLTDELIRKIAECGGVIGINYYSLFLNRDGKENFSEETKEQLIRHIKHMKDIGGVDCIGLGSDFDGFEESCFPEDAAELPKLADFLMDHGFSQTETEKIFYKNVLGLYHELL